MSKRSKIGLVLGGGGARGWAHIGIIQELEKIGIKPDIVVGCSAGALVGGVYANGKLDEFTDWILSLKWNEILRYLDVNLFRRKGGLIKGQKLFEFFHTQEMEAMIEDLPIPFAAVATDLDTGHEVWLREGSLLNAVRASISIPGFLTPVHDGKRWLVDGGLVNPVPVSLCRAMGADIIIAVHLNEWLMLRKQVLYRRGREGPSFMEAIGQRIANSLSFTKNWWNWGGDKEAEKEAIKNPKFFYVMNAMVNIMIDKITKSRLAGDPPDILLAPNVNHIGVFDFERAEEAIEEGRACVQRVAPSLMAILENGNY